MACPFGSPHSTGRLAGSKGTGAFIRRVTVRQNNKGHEQQCSRPEVIRSKRNTSVQMRSDDNLQSGHAHHRPFFRILLGVSPGRTGGTIGKRGCATKMGMATHHLAETLRPWRRALMTKLLRSLAEPLPIMPTWCRRIIEIPQTTMPHDRCSKSSIVP